MSVFVVAQLRFTDLSRYRRYQSRFAAVFKQFAGRLLAADEQPEILEGAWGADKVVLMMFQDEDQARHFLESPEYLEISRDRQAGAETTALLVQGLEQTQLPN